MEQIWRDIKIPQNSSQKRQKCPQGGRFKCVRVDNRNNGKSVIEIESKKIRQIQVNLCQFHFSQHASYLVKVHVEEIKNGFQ